MDPSPSAEVSELRSSYQVQRLMKQNGGREGEVGLVRVSVLALRELNKVAKGGTQKGGVDELQLGQTAARLPN